MSLDKRIIGNQIVTYAIVFAVVLACLTIWPPIGGYMWEPWPINIFTSALFSLLVCLTARLAGTDRTFLGLICTAFFLIFFCPGGEKFFIRDEMALQELGSQCIVPFFIGQYMRVSKKDFHLWYFLMLLMGVFCSYTHNGITIPLCMTFIWLSFLHRKLFFRRACWPMVVGFVIGTGFSLWQMRNDSLTQNTDIDAITSSTAIIISTLWDTKVFVVALIMIGYMALTARRRRILLYIGRRHHVIALCLLFSLFTLPFAPLGIDNAVMGVCFFSMFYIIFLTKYLVERYLRWRI